MYRGDHLKNALPHTLMLGSIFVLFDIIGRLIVYPYEIRINDRCIWDSDIPNLTNER